MACFQGYVSFREGISTVLLDFDDWYGCYSRDIDNKLEVFFLFFSFLFLSYHQKSSLDFWHGLKHGGLLVCFGFPPFLAVFFRFKRCFLAPFTALGVERLPETPPFLVRLCSILSRFRFSKKEISMVDTYIPPSKKRTDKRFTWNMFFCLVGRLSRSLLLKTQKLPWKIWMGPFSDQIYNCISFFFLRPKMIFRDPNRHPPPLVTSTWGFRGQSLRGAQKEVYQEPPLEKPVDFAAPGWNSPIAAPIASMGLVCLPTFTIKMKPDVGKCTIHGLYAACWRVPTFS